MQQQKTFSLFITLLIISFFIFAFDRWNLLDGLKSILLVAFHQPQKVSQGVASELFLNQQIKELQDENAKLTAQVGQLAHLQKENDDLKAQLGVFSEKKQATIPAHVLSTNYAFVIDKGSTDGVKVGMTVISKDMYVGKISSVDSHTSRVLLPYDKESMLEVRSRDGGAKGIVTGNGTAITLKEVLPSEQLVQDDVIETVGAVDGSGVGVKPNIAIGKITAMRKSENGLFQEAKIDQLVDYHTLATVFVLP